MTWNTLLTHLGTAAIGLLIGLKLPDLDLAPVLPLRHRSAWTHGPVLTVGLLLAADRWPAWAWLLLGGMVGCMMHLVSDMLPRSWRGSARINWYPLAYVSGPVGSLLWLAAGVAAPFWLVWGMR